MERIKQFYYDKQAQVSKASQCFTSELSLGADQFTARQVVLFSSTAIALYGYDQGMMSLINTNRDYLLTMGIAGDSPQVGLIVSLY